MMVELTKQQLYALAGTAVHIACARSKVDGLTSEAQQNLLDMNSTAVKMIAVSNMSPTELKNLGLNLVALAMRCPR